MKTAAAILVLFAASAHADTDVLELAFPGVPHPLDYSRYGEHSPFMRQPRKAAEYDRQAWNKI